MRGVFRALPVNRQKALRHMISALASTLRDDRGATIVEYAILVSLIAAVGYLVVSQLGKGTSSLFSSIARWGH